MFGSSYAIRRTERRIEKDERRLDKDKDYLMRLKRQGPYDRKAIERGDD